MAQISRGYKIDYQMYESYINAIEESYRNIAYDLSTIDETIRSCVMVESVWFNKYAKSFALWWGTLDANTSLCCGFFDVRERANTIIRKTILDVCHLLSNDAVADQSNIKKIKVYQKGTNIFCSGLKTMPAIKSMPFAKTEIKKAVVKKTAINDMKAKVDKWLKKLEEDSLAMSRQCLKFSVGNSGISIDGMSVSANTLGAQLTSTVSTLKKQLTAKLENAMTKSNVLTK